MEREQLELVAFDTKVRMAQFVRPFVTPIARSDDQQYGWAWGSGAYGWVESVRSAFLFTNEHVAAVPKGEVLAHLPRPDENYEMIAAQFRTWPAPIDFACAPIDLSRLSNGKDCLAPDQFDSAYSPVQHELLFWIGFPGTTLGRWDPMNEAKRRYSWGGELSIPGVPFLSQALVEQLEAPPEGYNHRFHELIHYPQEAKQEPGGEHVEVHNPRGVSGSLLWDTKRIACHWAGVDWEPGFARVCGLVWAAGEHSPFLIATRVEHVLACLAELSTQSTL